MYYTHIEYGLQDQIIDFYLDILRINAYNKSVLFGERNRYAILVDEEFSCLEFYMNRDTISWILKKVGCLSEITAYLF